MHHIDAGPLTAGNIHNQQVTIHIPGGVAPGGYHLGMIPSYAHDPDEGNNLIVRGPLLIGVDPPNIVAVGACTPPSFRSNGPPRRDTPTR